MEKKESTCLLFEFITKNPRPHENVLARVGSYLDILLSSMISALVAVTYIWFTGLHPSVMIAIVIFAVLVILRHRGNIKRMIQGTENKIRWI